MHNIMYNKKTFLKFFTKTINSIEIFIVLVHVILIKNIDFEYLRRQIMGKPSTGHPVYYVYSAEGIEGKIKNKNQIDGNTNIL